MNVVRCKNGHFFDGDSYEMCPHCGEGLLVGESKPVVKDEKKGFWNKGKKEKEESITNYDMFCKTNSKTVDEVTDVMKTEEVQSVKSKPLKNNPTLDFWQTSATSENSMAPVEPVKESEELEKKPEQVIMQQTSLKEAVKNASASNEGKTMSYFSTATSSSEKVSNKVQSEPVVGWLVCTKGAHFGEAFFIYSGKNSIGRNTENRIAITEDNSISRSKHALIVYEPKKRNFFIQPGDSSGLTYLNDEYITESHMLTAKDVIELGDSSFIFVPLCGQDFSWEEYI